MATANHVFVAMPFSPQFQKIYDQGIQPAIESSGLEALRVDEVNDNTSILKDIEEGIRASTFVVADVTGRNSNVLYEVGFARAVEKEIIVLTQAGDELPFDLKQHRYIHYGSSIADVEQLGSRLKKIIRNVLPRGLEQLKHQQHISKVSSYNPRNLVVSHGTKHTVPESYQFWNDLLGEANKRFYLVGHSNRSWIDKGEDQASILGDSILRLIGNGGTVRILSADQPEIIKQHQLFLREYVSDKVSSLGLEEQKKARSALRNGLNPKLTYVVYNSCHYGAVVSDDRMMLMPTLNSSEFRDAAMVNELVRGVNNPQFDNYLSDIDRLFKNGCRTIEFLEF